MFNCGNDTTFYSYYFLFTLLDTGSLHSSVKRFMTLIFVKANLPEGSAKPTLTSDEEESGSSTSSCEDEPMQLAVAEGQSEESQQKENKTTG